MSKSAASIDTRTFRVDRGQAIEPAEIIFSESISEVADTGEKTQPGLTWDIHWDVVIDEVGDLYSRVRIYDTPPEHTSVNMVGGRVDLMATHDSSTLNMTAGHISTATVMASSTLNISGRAEIGWATAYEGSTVNISGGDVMTLHGSGRATLNISGGNISNSVAAREWATLNISGGVIRDARIGLGILSISGDPILESITVSGMANIAGGEVATVTLVGSGLLNLRGGTISDVIEIGSGRGTSGFTGAVNVYGRDLAKPDTGGSYGHGQVYGSWLDGSGFVIDLGENIYPHVNLIPEPLTLLLLGTGAAIVRIRK